MNRFVIADPEWCIGCNTCLAACSDVHKTEGLQYHPRLTLVKTDTKTAPVMCRHCDDAPCKQVCPVNAISFKDDAVYLNETLCIGCKLCGWSVRSVRLPRQAAVHSTFLHATKTSFRKNNSGMFPPARRPCSRFYAGMRVYRLSPSNATSVTSCRKVPPASDPVRHMRCIWYRKTRSINS